MMEVKQAATVLERIQNVVQDYPTQFWVLMAGTFIDWLGTNLIMPFLAIYVIQRFEAKITQVDLRWVWAGCSIICAISIISFYNLHLHARERLYEM